MPEILVEYDPSEVRAHFSKSADLPQSIWNRLIQACSRPEVEVNIHRGQLSVPWADSLPAILELASLRRSLGFDMRAIGEAETRLREFKEDRRRVSLARNQLQVSLTADEIIARLTGLGFTKRSLTAFQIRDCQQLLTLSNGANFSVPGAGKTTVTFAVHLLSANAMTRLLVIAPKNAFDAWDEVIQDCITDQAEDWVQQSFVRLEGGQDELAHLLRDGGNRFLMTYERLVRNVPIVSAALASQDTHLILDESHRIKAGDMSRRGQAALAIAPLPVRRDILTGTPAPHSIGDLTPQLDFLWPGMGLGRRVLDGVPPREIINNLYVRTTKHELGLPPVTRRFVHVEMSEAQLALYGVIKSHALEQLGLLRRGGQIDLVRARRSVMRLLQVSANPVIAAINMGGAQELRGSDDEKLLAAVIEEGDSPKILDTCHRVRSLARGGRKTVVWTIFRDTINRLEAHLADLRPAVLHGGIPTGDSSDWETREGKIRTFHEDASCMVVIANPAACSEGISLHRVCHNAIYVDRSYNAAHYLQSIDRIHRLGLEPGTKTTIEILQSVAPQRLGSIDHSVSRRLLTKMRQMESILDDEDIRMLALDEEEAEPPIDRDITLDDIADLLEMLTTQMVPDEEEQV